jgi:mono/diheme cytochrome c family protein
MGRRVVRVCLAAAAALSPIAIAAQTPQTGAEMYRAWCAVCHGDDGTGRATTRTLRIAPIDFTDCRLTTAEPDADWRLVIQRGGHAAGLSTEMPAFEVLSGDQIDRLVAHVRTFCGQPRWPSGNANFRRALFTAKAFPEDEAALRPMVSHSQQTFTRVQLEASYERRVGRRAELEVTVPAESVGWFDGPIVGVGDIALGAKYVLHADGRRPRIATAGLEVVLPSGSVHWGFGEGTLVVEPYLAGGLRWRALVLQGDIRGAYYARQQPGEFYRHLAYNAAISHDLSPAPSAWTLGVEINGSGRAVGLTPYLVKGLTRTGSLTAAFGVRLPVTTPFPQVYDEVRWTGYLRWDFREPLRARK